MKGSLKYLFFIMAVMSMATCKTPYTPAPITATNNYLVVEGLINISDSTYISLSRSVNVMAKSTVKPELKAVIIIESNQGGSYPLKEIGNGVYAAAPLNLSVANQYRLRIKTTNGSTYVSDFTAAMVSPPIDSVSWKPTNTALEIYANTHDPNNATRYYRWDYTEEWEFHSNYDSFWVSDGLKVTMRDPAKHVWHCYAGDTSHVITVGTSIQLSKDIINQQLINTISPDAEKIGVKYSILVKQYGLTKNAYDYWTLLKKNTEQLGSVFDSQPSASIGNVHGVTNPAEIVIGYISAGTLTTQRIFIAKSQLPNWVATPFYQNCDEELVTTCPPPPKQVPPPLWQDQALNYKSPSFSLVTPLIPISAVGDPINIPCDGGWLSAPAFCVDCTLRGRAAPPAYWK